MHPTVKAARIAGVVYFSMIFTAPFTLLYIPNNLVVRGDPAATAAKILAHETLFRLGTVAEVAGAFGFVAVGILLYRLLADVGRNTARLMLALVVVSATMALVTVFNNLAALQLFKGADFLGAIAQPQREVMGMFFLRMHAQMNYANEMFWGLWLLPFGSLVMRSRFLPRVLGVWLLVNGVAYMALSVISLMTPRYAALAFNSAMPALFGEAAIMLYLIIRGANVKAPAANNQ